MQGVVERGEYQDSTVANWTGKWMECDDGNASVEDTRLATLGGNIVNVTTAAPATGGSGSVQLNTAAQIPEVTKLARQGGRGVRHGCRSYGNEHLTAAHMSFELQSGGLDIKSGACLN